MNRKQSQLIFLALITSLLTLVTSSAKAQEGYGLTIAGVPVTLANCSNLSIIPGVKGTVSYDPKTQTLSLKDATITATNGTGLEATSKLNCIVTGKVAIISEGVALSLLKSTKVMGSGELSLKSNKSTAIVAKDYIKVEDCTIHAEGLGGICGSGSGFLSVKKATVMAVGTEYGSIYDFSTILLKDCAIMQPAGAIWDGTKHAVCDANGNVIKEKVVVSFAKVYDISLVGVEVTSANCSDLSVIQGVTGKVSYNPQTQTLTLENAKIGDEESEYGIFSRISGLTCVVKGKVSTAPIYCNQTTIEGTGELSVNSKSGSAISVREEELTIKDCTVNVNGKNGIVGLVDGAGRSLSIKNATVTAQGLEGSICKLGGFSLEGCEITKPADATWNPTKHAVCNGLGNVITSEVVIAPTGGSAIDFVTPRQSEEGITIYNMNGVRCTEKLEELPTGVYIINGKKVTYVHR